MAKKFDMAALAKEALGDVRVSEVDTVRTLKTAEIDANAANFYEMSDLEELAASIELVGLLHPVTVKPEGGRYVLIDGERRFRAVTEVLGRDEIAAIVRTPVNDVVEELMLIEANRTQRKMSAADLSKQAERYTELLAQLKEAGVAIPGRLRDRVAEALQVSSTKLARLHAIREHLSPRMLERFDAGEINESMAYALSRYSHGQQAGLWDYGARTPEAVDIVARRAGFSVGYRDAAEAQPDEPRPEAPKTLEPAGTSWDAEAYLSQRRQEDDDFYTMLEMEADRFLPEISGRDSRQDGIQALKDRFGRIHHGWLYDEVDVQSSPRGLELACDSRAIPYILRTWTDVYDMLARIALERAAKISRVSKSNTKPAGLAWRRVSNDDLPPDDGEVVFWGVKGLRTAVAGSRVNYCQMWPEEYAWWATVEGPEEVRG